LAGKSLTGKRWQVKGNVYAVMLLRRLRQRVSDAAEANWHYNPVLGSSGVGARSHVFSANLLLLERVELLANNCLSTV
jgi:hypothetical protein